ncbi:hypothetical protein DOT36_12920, partial [Vibrio vulnificus]
MNLSFKILVQVGVVILNDDPKIIIIARHITLNEIYMFVNYHKNRHISKLIKLSVFLTNLLHLRW